MKAKIYIVLIITAGWVVLAVGLRSWTSNDLMSFLLYLSISVLTSGFKVRLPGITGTMSAGFLFTLIGIVCLSLSESLAVTCAAVLVQYFWHSTKQLRPTQMLFNVASASLAVTSSYRIYHALYVGSPFFEFGLPLAVLGCTYFVISTLLVAGVIVLTENRPLWVVWSGSYFWSFAYYLLGAATAGLFQITREQLGWQSSLATVPAAYIIYRAYRLEVAQLRISSGGKST